MTQTPKNPFVLPGLGQSPELAGNPIMASMEMMRQAWSSLAGAGGLAQSMPITPPLSLEDLERRISDLRTVENWLQLNLSLLGSTIQGLEVQRATISTLRAFADGMSASAPGGAGEGSPLDVLLGIRRSAEGRSPRQAAKPAAPQAAAATAAQAPAGKAPEAASAAVPGPEGLAAAAAEATPAAANAWWNLLQQQFDTLAQATAASMPGMGAGAAKPAAKSAAQPAAKPSAKPASAMAPAAKSSAAPRKRATKSSSKPAAKPAAKRAPRKTVAGG